MKSSVMKCKTANWTNKLPGTKYSTSEALAPGYAYIKHYNDYGLKKGRINESHTDSLTLMT